MSKSYRNMSFEEVKEKYNNYIFDKNDYYIFKELLKDDNFIITGTGKIFDLWNEEYHIENNKTFESFNIYLNIEFMTVKE